MKEQMGKEIPNQKDRVDRDEAIYFQKRYCRSMIAMGSKKKDREKRKPGKS